MASLKLGLSKVSTKDNTDVRVSPDNEYTLKVEMVKKGLCLTCEKPLRKKPWHRSSLCQCNPFLDDDKNPSTPGTPVTPVKPVKPVKRPPVKLKPTVIKLNGDPIVTVVVGDRYVDQGATTNDGSVVVACGTFDTTEVGTYDITYYAYPRGFDPLGFDPLGFVDEDILLEHPDQKLEDNVGVVARAAHGESKHQHIPAQPLAAVTRTIRVIEPPVTPVITLNGDATVTVVVGDPYVDQGATTNDGSEVVLGGYINTGQAGTYSITYDASNASRVTRTVNVVECAYCRFEKSVCAHMVTEHRMPLSSDVGPDHLDDDWPYHLDSDALNRISVGSSGGEFVKSGENDVHRHCKTNFETQFVATADVADIARKIHDLVWKKNPNIKKGPLAEHILQKLMVRMGCCSDSDCSVM